MKRNMQKGIGVLLMVLAMLGFTSGYSLVGSFMLGMIAIGFIIHID